jgi:pantothenate kinase type III
MPLCFGADIGNSGLRVAVLDLARRDLGPMLRINWRPVTLPQDDRHAVPDQSTSALPRFLPHDVAWTHQLQDFLQSNINTLAPQRWLISSVRRDALQVLRDFLGNSVESDVEVVDYKRIPLALSVDFPERVGIDRLLAALAASELTDSRPAVVIQAGSAVTVDLISAPPASFTSTTLAPLATFEGGAIIPGVPMMLRLLGKGADLLPELDADELLHVPRPPGKNTEAAMTCGAASALVGGVVHLVNTYRAQYGERVPVILSGGDGMRLAPYLPPPLVQRSHLVHYGLLKLAELCPTD